MNVPRPQGWSWEIRYSMAVVPGTARLNSFRQKYIVAKRGFVPFDH